MTKKPTEIKDFPGRAVAKHLADTGRLPGELDYNDMSEIQLVETCGSSAYAWADAFCQRATKLGYSPMDRAWVAGWFAVMIERSIDVRTGRNSTKQ